MAEPTVENPKGTLGLTGLTSNAMALIAPGAFLWLTFALQSLYGAPMAATDMWFGIVLALVLCLATAVSYAELAKLYPGAGSSYFYAEQAFLTKSKFYKFARIAKFLVGWASHLYYWVYPGVMVGVTALVAGYMFGQVFPNIMNPALPAPLFMAGFSIVFALLIGWIASRGVGGTASLNAAINVIQISALIVFSCIAIGYRLNHGATSVAHVIDPNTNMASSETAVLDASNNPVMMPDGKTPKMAPATLDDYKTPVANADSKDPANPPTRNYFANAADVVKPHNFNYIFIQACVAILILVGFESVTAMAEESKNPSKDIPKAVILSLVIQGAICYLFEYFAANYMLNSNYTMVTASGSAAPIGDMMQMAGTWAFGSPLAGWWFMMIQATTVFLALIGTTLSCLTTGSRVTYAMGRDGEVSETFGLLEGPNATPLKAVWTLAIISAVIGVFTVFFNFCGGAAQTNATLQALPHNFLYEFGLMENTRAAAIPQGMLIMTLVSNFGTFLLYMTTCIVAMMAFIEHHTFNGFKHVVVPVFGLLANLGCMIFYLVGPFSVAGMSWKEPYCALGVVAVWGLYGMIFFLTHSSKKGKSVYSEKKSPPPATPTV